MAEDMASLSPLAAAPIHIHAVRLDALEEGRPIFRLDVEACKKWNPIDLAGEGGAMVGDFKGRELIVEAAEEYDVPFQLIEDLLAVAESFTGFAAYGAKTDFSRRIAHILDQAAQEQANL